MPRITLITGDGDITPDRQAEVDAIRGTLGHLSGPFSVLLYSPGLAQKVMEAGAHVRLKSTLEAWQRELAILVTATVKHSDYEWASHVEAGRTAGLAETVIEEVRHGRDAPADAGEDVADIVTYVRQLVTDNRVGQAVYGRLEARHGERWLVELTATVGQYQYIATMLGAFEVEPGPGRERILG